MSREIKVSSFPHANDNIRLLLKFNGWSQDDLCEKTAISPVTLRRRLSGSSGWHLSEAVSISKAFKVSLNELFFTQMIPGAGEQKG